MLYEVTMTRRDNKDADRSTGVSLTFIVQYPESETLARVLSTLTNDETTFSIKEAIGTFGFSIGPLNSSCRI